MSAKETYKQLLSNQKSRTGFLIFVFVFIVLIVWFGVSIINTRKAKNNSDVAVKVTSSTLQDNTPGQSENPLYNEAIREQNLQQGIEALNNQQSFEPVLSNNIETESVIDKLAVPEVPPIENTTIVVPKPVEIEPVVQPVIVNPEPQVVNVSQKVAPAPIKNDNALIVLLAGAFDNRGTDIETDFTRKGPSTNNNGATINSNNNIGGTPVRLNNTTTNSSNSSTTVIDKAGTIYNAILDTAINTDEPGPVLATIVGGKFDKSKVLCQMQANDQTALVSCSTLSSPKLNKSLQVNLVAVSPETTRTGLATSVNNHYFERYVVGLGAAFLKGYADLLTSKNRTIIINSDGSSVQSTGDLSEEDMQKGALGEVAKTLADDVRANTQNLKPTVKVSAGTAIGLIVLTDIETN